MAVRVLVTESIDQVGLARLQAAPDMAVDVQADWSREELAEHIGAYQALIVRSRTWVDAGLLAGAVNLKVVGRAGVGVDNIDVTAATRRGVLVVNAPEANTISTAEHTMAMLLALARHIPTACAALRGGEWSRQRFMGVQLAGKILGVLGLGRIGSEVARRALAMDMQVLAYDPFISPEKAHQLGVTLAGVDQICTKADFVTVHTPLTAETKGLIGRRQLIQAKPGLRLVNCARGGIIDEAALLEALNEGRVAGAALDVFTTEPPTGNPLISHPHVIATPHLGASTSEAQSEAALEVVDAVLAALAGRPVRSAVNGAYLRGLLQDDKGYLDLAERSGRLFAALFDGGYSKLAFTYCGDVAQIDAEALTATILRGLLQPLAPEVNYINAGMLAEERGLIVQETRQPAAAGYTNLLTIQGSGTAGEHLLSVHLTNERLRRIVAIDGYQLHVETQGSMIVARNLDQPGIIGQVGTVLGRHGVNIGFMQVGRKSAGDMAVMVVGIDEPLREAAWRDLCELDVLRDVRLVEW